MHRGQNEEERSRITASKKKTTGERLELSFFVNNQIK
jgi:hypothetical protein